MATQRKTHKNKGKGFTPYHIRALQETGNRRRMERMEARVNQMLALLAERPMYRADLEQAMGISQYTLYIIVRYAKLNNWIVSQGRYHLNPHTVMVAGGKVTRLTIDDTCVTA